MYICVPCAVPGAYRSQKRAVSDPLEPALQVVEGPCVYWECNLDPLEEQPVLFNS